MSASLVGHNLQIMLVDVVDGVAVVSLTQCNQANKPLTQFTFIMMKKKKKKKMMMMIFSNVFSMCKDLSL